MVRVSRCCKRLQKTRRFQLEKEKGLKDTRGRNVQLQCGFLSFFSLEAFSLNFRGARNFSHKKRNPFLILFIKRSWGDLAIFLHFIFLILLIKRRHHVEIFSSFYFFPADFCFFLSLGLCFLVLRFDLIGKNSQKRFSLTPMVWRDNRVSRGFLYYARELKCQDICPGERAVVFTRAEST